MLIATYSSTTAKRPLNTWPGRYEATSAAFVRYAHGDIDPLIAVPTALCVFLGARAGAWLVPRTPNAQLKLIFGWVALAIAVLMVLQALGIYRTPGR